MKINVEIYNVLLAGLREVKKVNNNNILNNSNDPEMIKLFLKEKNNIKKVSKWLKEKGGNKG